MYLTTSNDSPISPKQDNSLSLQDFDFHFPEHLIANEPQAQRSHSKMLVYDAPNSYRHSTVADLTAELPVGTCVFFNDSKVFPSRLLGHLPTGGSVELFLLRQLEAPKQNQSIWQALGRPLRKLTPGMQVHVSSNIAATIIDKTGDTITVSFDLSPCELAAWIDKFGYVPLPPYIKRPDAKPALLSLDTQRYQTVYSRERGSVAAPTAGLHFSHELLEEFFAKNIHCLYLSLHVGAGTFLPVKSNNISNHNMHREQYKIPRHSLEQLFAAKDRGLPIIAIGTTSLRSLEDLYRKSEGDRSTMLSLCDQWLETELFIYPKTSTEIYRPWMIDGILTNFHQPKSTLFMLVASLLGLENIKAFYQSAFANNYRLFSYGDTSLLWLNKR